MYTPLYTQCDVRSCVPIPQVTEEAEPILQDDHVGHGRALQGSLLVRFDNPLSNNKKVYLTFTTHIEQRYSSYIHSVIMVGIPLFQLECKCSEISGM